MTATPSGAIANSKHLLRETLATATAFRTWEGNNWSVAQARERIYYDALPPPAANAPTHSLSELNKYRPFCLIYKPADAGSFRLDAVAAGPHNQFIPSGTLIARFERSVPISQQRDPGEADRQFENFIGQLLRSGDQNNPGIVELSGKAGYLNVTQIVDAGPFRSTEDEQPTIGDCQWYFLQLEWGLKHRV